MTANDKPMLGAMLLAAGGSSRLGRTKQLLKFEGETLLRRATRSLADSVYFPVVVVLGAENDSSLSEIDGLAVYNLINESWADGMSSSIRQGLERLFEIEPKLDGVLITLCDQPKISTEMLNRFADKFAETNTAVIAASYDRILGVPALFSRNVFGELLSLTGDKGARQIIRDRKDVIGLDLPEAAIDIDTKIDAERFGLI